MNISYGQAVFSIAEKQSVATMANRNPTIDSHHKTIDAAESFARRLEGIGTYERVTVVPGRFGGYTVRAWLPIERESK